MKKIVLFLAVAFACFFSASALDVAEIVGKWESKPINIPSEDKSIKTQSFLTIEFNDDNTAKTVTDLKMHIADGSGVYVDLLITFSSKGTYTVDADSIVIADDISTIESDYDISIRGVEDEQAISIINSQMEGLVHQMMPAISEEMKKDPTTTLTGVVILGKKMMCTISEKAVTFNRKKK